jgi:hypothetical protein
VNHVCRFAGWVSLCLLALPAVAHAAELAVPGTVPGVESIGAVSWPAAMIFGIYSLKGAKVPTVNVRVRVVTDDGDSTAEAPKS